jgi:hypothetical protein
LCMCSCSLICTPPATRPDADVRTPYYYLRLAEIALFAFKLLFTSKFRSIVAEEPRAFCYATSGALCVALCSKFSTLSERWREIIFELKKISLWSVCSHRATRPKSTNSSKIAPAVRERRGKIGKLK